MKRRIVRAALWGTLLAVPFTGAAQAAGHPAAPPEPPPSTQVPPPTVPQGASDELIPVPDGCPRPDPAAVVFVGTMIGKDDVTQTVRFRIDQLRAGSGQPWAIDGLIDVRYGEDYRFLEEDHPYLVGAGFDPTYGALSSTVRAAEPDFGGNDVVGVDDVAVVCPTLDDPVRTLEVDGSDVDSGVLSLLTEDRRLLLATLAVPTAIVFAALLALVILKVFGVLAMRGVFRLGRAAVTPVPDHRVVRVRRHREAGTEHPTSMPGGVPGSGADSDQLTASQTTSP